MAIEFDQTDELDSPEVSAAMNITPLIDVLLVLLVMIIITIPIQLHSVDMAMPVGLPPEVPETPLVVSLEITASNQLLWNGVMLESPDALRAQLQRASQGPTQPEIHIQSHQLAKYDTLAAVLSAAQSVGMSKVGIVSKLLLI
jgi:biopolymer transport protein ExbD